MIWSGDFISGQGDASESLVQPGAVIDGKYEVVALVGVGGMGSVYKARHTEMGNYVALKFLHPRFASDPDAVKRFQREAHIISALRHKNILSVYAFGRYRGMLYIAVEYIEGTSLHWLITDQGKLDVSIAMPVFLQICQAMAYAHHNHVLHRDLKPDNVILLPGQVETTGSGTVKVVDFGLAKLLDGSDVQKLTKTGEVVGDPNYMSPEQCQGRPLDARSDIYSMGCLMYECLSGEPPFVSDSPVATLYRHVCEKPAPFAQRCSVPAALESITLTCIDKKPDNRYESFAALAEALQNFEQNPNLKTRAPRSVPDFSLFLPRKPALIVYTVVFALLAGGLGLALYQSTLSKRDESNADSELLAVARERLRQFDFKLSQGKDISKREAMQAIKLGEELGDTNAMVRASIALADSYAGEQQPDRAYEIVQKVDNLPRLSAATRQHLDAKIANFAYSSGHWAEAERLMEPIYRELQHQNQGSYQTGNYQSVALCLADAKFHLKKEKEARALVSDLRNIQFEQEGRLNFYMLRLLEIYVSNGMNSQSESLVAELLAAQLPDNDKLDALTNVSLFYGGRRDWLRVRKINQQIIELAARNKHASALPYSKQVIALFHDLQADKLDQVMTAAAALQPSLEIKKKPHWPRAVWATTYSEAMVRSKRPADEAMRPLYLLNIDLHNFWKW